MIMVEFDRSHPLRPSHHYSSQGREASHLHHLEHRSAPSTPSPPYQYAPLPSFGSQHQQASPSVRSTPTSYPSPASFPSPSMSAFSYPPQQGHQSPHFQPLHSSSISLPPIRTSPHLSSVPPPITSSSQIGSALPPPPIPPHTYYSPHPHVLPTSSVMAHPHLASSPLPQPLRYPLPHNVQPERIMSGGRHKKEIKRRTKTGCLTCRKRRIKCDETHPTCKNCAKSKRECMGYDPIKTHPGPAAIQPAPTSAVGGSNYAPTISTAGNSPASSCEPYDYAGAIDPLLEAATPLPSASVAINFGVNIIADASATYRPDLKRPVDRTSPFSCASDTPRVGSTSAPRSNTPSDSVCRDNPSVGHPAKRIKIDDLLSGAATRLPLTPPSSEQASNLPNFVEEFKFKYRNHYAPMMDELLGTGWFETRGVARVVRGGPFIEALAALFSKLKARNESYVEEVDSALINLGGDAEVLLDCVRLMYGSRAVIGENHIQGRDDDHADAADIAKRDETSRRIAVLEALVTGNCTNIDFSSRQSSPKSSPRHYEDPHITLRSSRFWTSLAKFVSLSRDREREIDEVLDEMAANICENTHGSNESHNNKKQSRDALYHIALARHFHNKLCTIPNDRVEFSGERRNLQAAFDKAKAVVVGTARSEPKSYLPRICGRAVGIWSQPITQ